MSTLKINTNNSIEIDNNTVSFIGEDGHKTFLYVTQRGSGTVVYSASATGGLHYKEHKMPHNRYSLTHPRPLSGAAGLEQFEADVREILKNLV